VPRKICSYSDLFRLFSNLPFVHEILVEDCSSSCCSVEFAFRWLTGCPYVLTILLRSFHLLLQVDLAAVFVEQGNICSGICPWTFDFSYVCCVVFGEVFPVFLVVLNLILDLKVQLHELFFFLKRKQENCYVI